MATTLAITARLSATANLAGTVLNGLAPGAECSIIEYDNSTTDSLALLTVELGTMTPASGGNIRLHHYYYGGSAGASAPDRNGQGSTTPQPQTLLAGATPKRNVFLVALVPGLQGFTILNNAAVSCTTTNNAVYIQPYNGEAR